MLYFAYGSNINLDQMRSRCPDAKVVSTVTLPDYELLFRGFSGDGLATIQPREGSVVHDLLWEITPSCERSLDCYEGFPRLYDKWNVEVQDSQGQSVPVMVYVMVEVPRLRPATPHSFYYQGILDGYRQTGLPEKALEDALEHAQQEVRELEYARQEARELDSGQTQTDSQEAGREAPGKLYFAYGSNTNLEQMKERCPDAEPVCGAVLDNYSLVFRSRNDGNGVAAIVPHEGQRVHGVLWKLTAKCERSLDRWEGWPFLYDKQTVAVRDRDGNHYNVMTYSMTHVMTREPAVPSQAYYQRIQDGYRQNKLPVRALSLALRRTRDEAAERRGGIHPDKGKEGAEQRGEAKKEAP